MLDLIIIGGSAAATAAGIYAARRNINFKIITRDFGGEIATSGEIANWPGVVKTDGLALAQQFKEHLESYGVEVEEGVEVEKVSRTEGGAFCIAAKSDKMPKMAIEKLPDGQTAAPKCDYVAKTVIIATGVHPKVLDVPGEAEFRNKGVSYCTVCDGPIFKDKTVAVIGGGNSALEAALMLADIAAKVYALNKNPEFKGEEVLINNLKSKENVEIIYNANTTKIFGTDFVNGLAYLDSDGKEEELKAEGIFIHIGQLPNSDIAPQEVEKNKFGEIVVNKNCETNIPGLYAAGDVTDIPFKQIVIAAGQGTVALLSAVNYLNKLK